MMSLVFCQLPMAVLHLTQSTVQLSKEFRQKIYCLELTPQAVQSLASSMSTQAHRLQVFQETAAILQHILQEMEHSEQLAEQHSHLDQHHQVTSSLLPAAQ